MRFLDLNQDYALLFLTIHHDAERLFEAHVAHETGLLDGWHLVEHVFAEDALPRVGIDGEIANAKLREVLKEMGSLRRIHTIVLQRHLDNDSRRRDVRPLYGNAQPMIARPPPSWSAKNIVGTLSEELAVDEFDVFGNGGVVHRREIIVGLLTLFHQSQLPF